MEYFTNKDEGDDDKEEDGFFISDFGDLSIHEEKVDEFIFRSERDYKIIIVSLLIVVLGLN
jgi:hypothetical protein